MLNITRKKAKSTADKFQSRWPKLDLSTMRLQLGQRWWLLLFSIAYGIAMLGLNGSWSLYSISPYHRLQADALLHGHFYLADSIEALRPGLAWHDGRVQQVWGLGIGFWLLPFQAVWSLLGGQEFPDRIALAVAFALLCFYASSTGLGIVKTGRRAFGLALIWLVVLCPPVWTLCRTELLIFEETVLYAILLSLGILVCVIRVVLFGSRRDFSVCCLLCSMAVWVRPTHAIYGLSAILVTSVFLWKRERRWKHLFVGNALWLVSLVLLGWTNSLRFGSPLEFGHRLTVSTGSMVYLTRFGNPYHQAPLLDAAKELFGLLFLNPNVSGANAFAENMFPLQLPITRWRRLDLTTFDLSYAILCAAALVCTSIWWFSLRRPKMSLQQQSSLVPALTLWSMLSAAGLSGFYLYYPAIASRYLMDFAPAFAGFAVVVAFWISCKWGRWLVPLLASWLLFEIACAKVPVVSHDPVYRKPAAPSSVAMEPVSEFSGSYTLAHHPSETGIAFNGYGWDADGGFASDMTILTLDKPEFLELRVSDRRASNGEQARKDVYRAQIEGLPLSVREVTNADEEGTKKVIFHVPDAIRARKQNEVVFLCFSSGYDVEDRDSERFLYFVRWK